MSRLSICKVVEASSFDGDDAAAIQRYIDAKPAPLLVAEKTEISRPWQDVTVHTLGEKIDPATRMAAFLTPSGIVGYYSSQNVKVELRDGRIWGRSVNSQDGDEAEVPHVVLEKGLTLARYCDALRENGTRPIFFRPREFVYLRTIQDMTASLRGCMAPRLPCDAGRITNTALFLSQAGMVTNLHWDGDGGILQQLKGRKRVTFFPPSASTVFGRYPRNHFLARRSRFAERLNEDALREHPEFTSVQGYECVVEPDQWLYMPTGWVHTVETLDDDCISLVIRLADRDPAAHARRLLLRHSATH